MVDTWFISLTGDADLVAGVSVCAPVFVLSIAMGDIWGLGGSSVISRLLGQKQDIKAGGVSAFCLYSSLAMGLLFMAVMLLFQDPILRLLGANDASMHHASGYFTWIAIGTPFIILSMIPNNQLRTEGLSTLGMWGAVAGSITNIALDPLFIFALNMGAAGAAHRNRQRIRFPYFMFFPPFAGRSRPFGIVWSGWYLYWDCTILSPG